MQAHFNDSSAELSVGMAQADVIKRVMLIERACISVSIGFQSIQVDELLYMCVCRCPSCPYVHCVYIRQSTAVCSHISCERSDFTFSTIAT